MSQAKPIEKVLVANREAAADPSKRAAMDDIVTLLRGAIEAEPKEEKPSESIF